MAERVVVAMSGGVDSSVAAALLCSQGYDVVGATLHLWDYPDDGSVESRCCAPEDIHDARRVSDKLGIAHYAFDRRELFAKTVVQPFVDAYLRGETPSPCVSCNRGVKIKELVALADKLGATRVATGHYARLARGSSGIELRRAKDQNKDQSYFLHMLEQGVLARLLFPLGELSKAEVRAEAVRLDLPGAHKGESQELCFVSSGRYDSFVAERAGDRVRPGLIVDDQGRTVGEHRGIHTVTLGQRRNLGVAVGQRAYVTAIDNETGVVRLGARDDLLASGALLKDATFAQGVSVPFECEVAVRYRGRAMPARVEALGAGQLTVRFAEPVHAVVPGQVAVFYQGDRVLGGGTIEQALRAAPQPEAPNEIVGASA
jgi:tRNA-specific 2-thiouridylase